MDLKSTSKTTRKLGQILVETGAITGEQLIRAIQSQRAVGGRLGTCLLEMDVLTEDHLLEALSQQLRVPAADIDQLRGIKDEILDLLPEKVALRCQAVPLFTTDKEVAVATLHVMNLSYLDELAFCTNKKVVPYIANEVRIFEALEKYYGHQCPQRYGYLLDRLNRSRYLWEDSTTMLFEEWNAPQVIWQDLDAIVPRTPETEPTAANHPEGNGSAAEVAAAEVTAQTSPHRDLPDRNLPTPPKRVDFLPGSSKVPADGLAPNQVPSAQPVRVTPYGNPVPAPTAPAEQAAQEDPPPTTTPTQQSLSLDEVDQLLSHNPDRDLVGEVTLRYLSQFFSRCALFKVQQQRVRGWLGRGEGMDLGLLNALSLPLDQPSIFHNLACGSEMYLGPFPALPVHQQLFKTWGGERPKDCFMMPLKIRDRIVCILYGDRGKRGLQGVEIESFRRLAEKVTMAFELCILQKKIHGIH